MLRGAVDSDILIKGASYLLLTELIGATQRAPEDCGVLGAAKFVVLQRLRKSRHRDAIAHFEEALRKLIELEPDDSELASAADIELEAQRKGLALDIGESILVAIMGQRRLEFLATGDKRAVVALEHLARDWRDIDRWRSKLISLEQLVRRLLDAEEPADIRDRICAAEDADRTLAICFRCTSRLGDSRSWRTGLDSYITDLRSQAPTVLIS